MHGMYYIVVFPVHLMRTACTYTSTYTVHSSVVVRGTFCYFVVYRAFSGGHARLLRLRSFFRASADMHGMYNHIVAFRALSIRGHLLRHLPLYCVRLQLRLHFVVFLCGRNCVVDIHLLRMST